MELIIIAVAFIVIVAGLWWTRPRRSWRDGWEWYVSKEAKEAAYKRRG